MTRPVATPAEPSSALTRLLEAESRLEALLDDARRHAAAIVAAAEDQASALAGAVDRELAEAEANSARRQAEAAAERLRAMVGEREAALERLGRNRSDRIDGLAAWVSEQVVQSITGNGGTR